MARTVSEIKVANGETLDAALKRLAEKARTDEIVLEARAHEYFRNRRERLRFKRAFRRRARRRT